MLKQNKYIFKVVKNSYDSLSKENEQLKEYIVNIKQRFKQYQQQQQQQKFLQDREYFQRPQPKTYKIVVYKEETDSESEAVEGQYVPETNLFNKEKRRT